MLLAPWPLVGALIALADAMSIIIGTVLLSLLVHDKDPLLPVIVCLRDTDPDAGDDQSVQPGYSLSYGGDHHPTTIGVVAPPCQLGFVLQFLEEDSSRISAHLHFLHPLLMDFLDGGVPEHGLEFADEVVPVWVLVSWAGGISVIVDPKVFSSVGSPTLGAFGEEGGGTDHHE